MGITYIICAAGDGTRFKPLLGGLPKPLIKMKGVTMLEWALRSLPVYSGDRLVLITRRGHRAAEKMRAAIEARYPFCSVIWHEIETLTRGQLETALLAEPYWLPGSAVVIYNCDTYFESRALPALLNGGEADGIIPCFQAEGESWSFCAVDNQNRAIDVKEKERISDWASVGFYYFRDGCDFFRRAEKRLKAGGAGEYYVAPLYQEYIAEGKTIIMDPINLFKPMGTPEQVENFWGLNSENLWAENYAPVLVMDLDGTITIDEPAISYADKAPNMAVIEKMREFAKAGWNIIIHTSRRMQTFGNDEARVVADTARVTQSWLERHQVPYNGLRFGKPYAHQGFYVDDKAVTPQRFLKMRPQNSGTDSEKSIT